MNNTALILFWHLLEIPKYFFFFFSCLKLYKSELRNLLLSLWHFLLFIGPLQLTYLEVYWEMTKVLYEAVSITLPASVAKLKCINILNKSNALQNKILWIQKFWWCNAELFYSKMFLWDAVIEDSLIALKKLIQECALFPQMSYTPL